MKIATWNINGVVNRLDLLLGWLAEAQPDILCLQELKVAPAQFPAEALEAAGYGAVWRAEGRWNGVAILARGQAPVLTRTDLPGDLEDGQARYIEAAVDGRIIASVYVPNGNPLPGAKFDYKLGWLDRLSSHVADLLKTGAPVILAGDYNVAPEAIDIYETRSYDDSALIHPECRARFDALLKLGLIDTFRRLQPFEITYTFWDYRRRRWQRNAGLRLDHILMNDLAALGLAGCGVDSEERGRDGASDHSPFWVRSN